jgi:hypothetical protein
MIIDRDKTVELGMKHILVPLFPSQISHGLVWDRMGMVRNVNVAVFVTFSTVFIFHFKQCKIRWGLVYSAVTKHVERYGANLQHPPPHNLHFICVY